MKTLELKLNKDMLIVEAPLDAYDISIGTHCIGVRTNENVEKDTNGFYHIYKKGLFFGDIDMKLEFLCKGSELTEEILINFIDVKRISSSEGEIFPDFKNKGWLFGKPNRYRSFISAVESKGFHWLGNNSSIGTSVEDYKQWQEAEEKTFRNPLIFVKNA